MWNLYVHPRKYGVEVDGADVWQPVVDRLDVDPQLGKLQVQRQCDHQRVHLEEVDDDLELVQQQAGRLASDDELLVPRHLSTATHPNTTATTVVTHAPQAKYCDTRTPTGNRDGNATHVCVPG